MKQFDNVLSWASTIDENALEQAKRTSRLPFLAGPLALMPDAHWGRGSTVGSVIPTIGAIIPSAIGVDIGCGMIAAELPFTSDLLGDNLDELHNHIAMVVPAGVGKGHDSRRMRNWSRIAHHWPTRAPYTKLSYKDEDKAKSQFGTLGSGNHFVEICLDERDRVWIVLHSGSRGIGKELAESHISSAKYLMRDYFIELEDPDLAYLVDGTQDFRSYIEDMLWAQAYALGNREVMLDAILAQIKDWTGNEFETIQRINCHHNYTELEHHHGRNVWLTRKGAIRAREGDLGVIPGSMGTSSYIVRGLGNPASYHSCSHGAGRRMSRGQARRELDVDGLRTRMKGKTWNSKDANKLIDEDPRAYKPIDVVMEDQKDLCVIEHKLHQVLNYKGL